MATQDICFGRLTLQPGRQLLADGAPVPLGRKSLDILEVLAGAEGGLVTKDELMEAVWPGLIVEENAIQAHVAALRKALGGEAERLKTVRGFGYRLEVPAAGPIPSRRATDRADRPSVAVLPFANLTGDPARDYLADGMAEELICTLSRTSDLAVPARTSTFAYKGLDRDIREIARELGVGAVLEGSIRMAGNRIRVTAQLIDAPTGFHIWSENYDRELSDLIGLQDDIALAIAGSLRARLGNARRRTGDAEAFDLCLRGRSLIDRGSPENLLRAIALFEQAVRRDPDFADARTGLAKALVYACSRGVLEPHKYAEALVQARRACALDPEDAAAHGTYACALARIGDWVGAGTHLERAIDLHEADPDLHCIYGGGFLVLTGRLGAAERHSNRARQLAPASAVAHVACATVQQFLGRHEAALALVATAIELGFPPTALPIPTIQATAARVRQDYDSAAHHTMQEWPQLVGPDEFAIVRTIYDALSGRASRAAAAAGVRALIARARSEQWIGRYLGFSAFMLEWALLLEDRELAYEVTDLIVESWSASGVLDIGGFTGFWRSGRAHLREDARFQAFCERIGLTAYWEAFGPPGYARQ